MRHFCNSGAMIPLTAWEHCVARDTGLPKIGWEGKRVRKLVSLIMNQANEREREGGKRSFLIKIVLLIYHSAAFTDRQSLRHPAYCDNSVHVHEGTRTLGTQFEQVSALSSCRHPLTWASSRVLSAAQYLPGGSSCG